MATQVTQYSNYRAFLKDWLEEKRKSGRAISARQFARRAEISSPSYLQRVITTQVKLSEPMIGKFIKGLGLKAKDARYFSSLVRFNQSEDVETKASLLKELEKLSRSSRVKEVQDRNLDKDWFLPVIWELASCKNAELTPELVVEALNQAVSLKEAERAIQFLESAGYLKREPGTHRFAQAELRIQSVDEIADLYANLLHRKFSELAIASTARPVPEREFQGITMALSPERFLLAKSLIKDFAQELVERLANDAEATQVYRINLQLFPLTQKMKLNPNPRPLPTNGVNHEAPQAVVIN